MQCQYDEYQGGVCRDSCCEFFVSPSEGSDDKTPFFNFECNAGGTMLLYHCTRGDAGNVEVELGDDDIPLAASLVDTPTGSVSGGGTKILPEITEPTVWTIEYHVPWKLFERYHGISAPPASGTQWRANFYKCADQTSHPHWCDPTVTPSHQTSHPPAVTPPSVTPSRFAYVGAAGHRSAPPDRTFTGRVIFRSSCLPEARTLEIVSATMI